MSAELFERAARAKIRYATAKGTLSVEDLYDLPLTSERGVSLDGLARGLHLSLRNTADVSFVTPSTASKDTELLQLLFDVVKHVIEVRLAEREAEKVRRDNREKKDRLLAVLEHKETEELSAKSADEIRQMIEAL